MDAAGNLYGTAANGGTDGSGVVFKLAPKPAGGWGLHVAHQFKGGKDGANPWAGLIFDAAGNLYGTTLHGGIVGCGNFFQYGCGTVFEVTPKPDGSWGEHVMYRFRGHKVDGFPYAGLVFDTAGNLYGTASYWWGTVFEITP